MKLVDKISEHLFTRIQNDELSNQDILQLIETLGSYLNLETIANRANRLGIDYNCVKSSNVEKRELFGVKFVIDNK